MKKIFLLASLVCAFGTMTAHAQGLFQKHERVLTLPANYVCYRTNEPIKIDGKLKEKSWDMAQPTAPFVDISGEGFAKPIYNTQAKMLWDDNYLYVSAVLEEPNITANLTERDCIIFHDNDFEVFIDPDGDGHNYFEIENNARGVIFDLMLNRPYRSQGDFFKQWNCPGIKLAVKLYGTMNKPKDKDKEWVVEMAIPRLALASSFDNPLKAGKYWRLNFSRVQWLKKGGPEENWVWQPTGKIDMHMPDRWGYLYFSDKTVGQGTETFKYPYNMDVYKLLWAMFYEQKNFYARERNYIRSVDNFFLTDAEYKVLPEDAKIKVNATDRAYDMSIEIPSQNVRYTLNHEGRFGVKKMEKRFVKNWMWMRINRNKSDEDYLKQFKLIKDCGISGIMFEGYDERVYKLCKQAGLEAHYWKWTMNRGEVRKTHPEWYAVNYNGESCYDKPAYVDYYRFLCPYHEGVAEYLAQDYVKISKLPYVDGVHLDYARFPDIVLPLSLWKNYRIEQTKELPEYDYCYCDVCRKKFKELTGKDPKDLQYPQMSQSWVNFRLDGISKVIRTIANTVKANGGTPISSAVFPGPSMAKSMVRQDWGNWNLDAYFPMIYNGFYYEGTEWIGRSVKESVETINGRAKVYAGLFFPHIKNNFEEALDAAFENGASGVSFFDGPSEEALLQLKEYLKKHGYVIAK